MRSYSVHARSPVSGNVLAFSVLLIFWAGAAYGHVEAHAAQGWLTGFMHPISGFDHVLAMVAVGLWGAQLGAPAIWVLPVAFPLVMVFGAVLGFIGIPLPGIELGIAASAILLGAAVMFSWRPPLVVALILVGLFAIFHGHAHGVELPSGQSAMLYSMGFVVATGLLHGLGIGIGTVQRLSWGVGVMRFTGALIALAGVYFLSKVLM